MHETLMTQTDKCNIFMQNWLQNKIWECNWITEISNTKMSRAGYFAYILQCRVWLCSHFAEALVLQPGPHLLGSWFPGECGHRRGFLRVRRWSSWLWTHRDYQMYRWTWLIYVQVCPAAAEAGACCLGRNRSGLFHSSPSTTA